MHARLHCTRHSAAKAIETPSLRKGEGRIRGEAELTAERARRLHQLWSTRPANGPGLWPVRRQAQASLQWPLPLVDNTPAGGLLDRPVKPGDDNNNGADSLG